VEIKCQLDATDEFLLKILLLAQHVSGHHYAHHQELEIIIKVVAACRIWCLVFKLSVWCGAEGCVSGLRDAAAARKPNTQPSAPQIHLLHLVGILFPHIIDDARSKPHQAQRKFQ
jgi:hypothetical protein